MELNTVPSSGFEGALQGFGIPYSFARAYSHTVQSVFGTKPFPNLSFSPKNCGLLLALGWAPKHNLADWANQDFVKAAFAKQVTSAGKVVYDKVVYDRSNE